MKPWHLVQDRRLQSAMREWRVERSNLTQSEVAKAIGVHRSTYNLMENGRQPMTYEQLQGLATFYKTDPNSFLQAGEPEPKDAFSLDVELPPAARSWLYRTLGNLAAQGFDDTSLHEAKEVLTAPVIVRAIVGPRWSDEQTIEALSGVLDAIVIPSLARRASGGG